MKHTIARKIFDKCMEAIANGVSCATVFGHKGKSAAMDHIWANRTQLFADYLAAPDKIQYCRSIPWRSEEHTSELQSLMRISYAVFCLKKKNTTLQHNVTHNMIYINNSQQST